MNVRHAGMLFALLLVCNGRAWSEDGVDKVVSCMRANIPQTLQVKEIELTATDRSGGMRHLRGRLYAKREDGLLNAMMKIAAPTDLAGAAYLLREKSSGDETFMYVPALQRVRRITGAAVDGTLWGTDISYGDIKQLNSAFSTGAPELLGRGELEGRAVYKLLLTRQPGDETQYTSVKVWVDQKSCVTLRADFMEGESVAKRFNVDPESLRQSGTIWYGAQADVSDLKEGTHTELKVVGVSSGSDLAERLFNPHTFYVGS